MQYFPMLDQTTYRLEDERKRRWGQTVRIYRWPAALILWVILVALAALLLSLL